MSVVRGVGQCEETCTEVERDWRGYVVVVEIVTFNFSTAPIVRIV